MSYDPHSERPRATTPIWVVLVIIFACFMAMLFVLGLLIALLLPAIQAAREAARRNACTNNMKMLSIALLNYHDTYKTFPPAYLADADGKPMHSWRVLILPFIDDAQANRIFAAYDFKEPWNGPNNSRLAEVAPNVFQCPSSVLDGPTTSYVAVVGPDTVWPGDQAVRFRDIKDGTSQTILLVEAVDAGVHWMEPKDLDMAQIATGVNAVGQKGISSNHPRGVNAAFCDGSVRFLGNDTTPQQLDALLTRAGGD